MKQKELYEDFYEPFGLHGLYEMISALYYKGKEYYYSK